MPPRVVRCSFAPHTCRYRITDNRRHSEGPLVSHTTNRPTCCKSAPRKKDSLSAFFSYSRLALFQRDWGRSWAPLRESRVERCCSPSRVARRGSTAHDGGGGMLRDVQQKRASLCRLRRRRRHSSGRGGEAGTGGCSARLWQAPRTAATPEPGAALLSALATRRRGAQGGGGGGEGLNPRRRDEEGRANRRTP